MASPRIMGHPVSPRMLSQQSSMNFMPGDHRGLDDLMAAMVQQQARGARKFQQMRRQAESHVEAQAYWEEKARRREQRREQRECELEAERQGRIERATEVEQRRRERQEAAERNECDLRAAAMAGVQAKDAKAELAAQQRQSIRLENAEEAAANAIRRRAAAERERMLQEEHREAAEHKQQVVVETLQRYEQQRQAALQAKHEEEREREAHRQETKTRADEELAGRVGFYRERVADKERMMEQRRQELEELRQLRADEARQRSDHIMLQAQAAAERDADARAVLQMRVQDKMKRAEALAEQRQQLVEQMKRLRHQMAQQEELVRSNLSLASRMGSFQLPPEVMRSLEMFSPAVGFSVTSPRSLDPASRSSHRTATHSRLTRSAQGSSRAAREGAGMGTFSATLRSRPSTATGVAPTYRRASSAGTTSMRAQEAAHAEYKRYTNVIVVPSPDSRREAALRALLSLEVAKESERQEAAAAVKDEREHARLQQIFAAERELAKQKILGLSSAAAVPLL